MAASDGGHVWPPRASDARIQEIAASGKPDAVFVALRTAGYSGSLDDMWAQHLANKGITDTSEPFTSDLSLTPDPATVQASYYAGGGDGTTTAVTTPVVDENTSCLLVFGFAFEGSGDLPIANWGPGDQAFTEVWRSPGIGGVNTGDNMMQVWAIQSPVAGTSNVTITSNNTLRPLGNLTLTLSGVDVISALSTVFTVSWFEQNLSSEMPATTACTGEESYMHLFCSAVSNGNATSNNVTLFNSTDYTLVSSDVSAAATGNNGISSDCYTSPARADSALSWPQADQNVSLVLAVKPG